VPPRTKEYLYPPKRAWIDPFSDQAHYGSEVESMISHHKAWILNGIDPCKPEESCGICQRQR
jgi:hypothetical protein